MNIKSAINWTRSPVIALTLLCAVFSFSAMAQDSSNKPLDVENLSKMKRPEKFD